LQLFVNVVHAALATAVRTHVLPVNPAAGVVVRGGQAVSKAGAALTPDEMSKFLAVDPDDRLLPLWHTAAATGCRPGELLALRWSDLDLDAGTLAVARTLTSDASGRPAFGPCKAGSARTIPIGAGLVAVLKRHRTRQREARLKVGQQYWVDPELCFSSEVGSILDPHNVARAFRRRCKAAKVRAVRWYDLRHSVGSALVAAGVDVKTVSQILGHRDTRTTAMHYVHPNDQQRRSAIAKLPWGGPGGDAAIAAGATLQ
jgi:integrase